MCLRLQFGWIALALFAVAAQGCLMLPYGIPTISQIEELSVPSPGDDVHVFRVDGKATQSRGLYGLIDIDAVSVTEMHRLARIDCGEAGVVDAQWDVGTERGVFYLGMFNGIPEKQYDTLAIHLYRPGYETIRIEADADRRKLEWKPVVDNTQRERAVDELLGPVSRLPNEGRPFQEGMPATPALLVRGVLPGVASPANREALLFCAAEYERIAGIVGDDEPEADSTRERLRDKANLLRELADRD